MDIGWKLASGIATGAAGFAANKAVGAGWKGFTGRETPLDDADDNFSTREILIFAIASAVVVAVAQVLATQAAKKWYGPVRDA
ncbi:MAG: DUF4235 domain-containing protein [bacterium]|nr:DUF4235 domain-containing protein [bacterium]